MLDKLTREMFEPVKGHVFELSLGPESTLPLELAAVQGNGLRGPGTREQFSLHFRGPKAPELPQRIYRLTHAQLGAMEIFLVPIARDGAGMTYEAVFT